MHTCTVYNPADLKKYSDNGYHLSIEPKEVEGFE